MTTINDEQQSAAQERLLNEVFPGGGLSHAYLDWLYRQSPDGAYIASDYLEAGKLLGHYAIIPQQWYFGGQPKSLALSLNTAVHEDARGKGLFTKLADETYLDAAQRGVAAVIGVANANSTPGFMRRLGFTLLTPLPVVGGLVLPMASKTTVSHTVDAAFLRSDRFAELAASIDTDPDRGACQAWPLEKLRWRLASPRGRYALHVHDSGILITTTAPLPVGVAAVIALKFLRRRGARTVDVKPLLRRAAAHHKSPFFIYSGFNDHARVTGMPVPRRLLPSPLNLIYRKLHDAMPESGDVRFAVFEFLDFDAY